jgi:hypothetical protein
MSYLRILVIAALVFGAASLASATTINLISRETEDLNSNGHIDCIRLLADAPLNDNYMGLNITVVGYMVVGYDTGAILNDNEFFTRLAEGAGPDTSATPGVQVLDGGSLELAIDKDPVTPANGTPEPATLSLLALGGLAMLRRRRK